MSSSKSEPRIPSDEEFAFVLEDRAFVDYFNVFLALPIFGQHIFYNYIEKVFVYEPPIRKNRNYVDRRAVIKFLRQERYPLFEQSCLYVEYLLCCRLRDMDIDFENHIIRDDTEKRSTFARNVLGHTTGMQMFREFLRGTVGENIYKCWIDIEKWHLKIDGDFEKTEMAHQIKLLYLAEGASHDLRSRGKNLVFEGTVDFELIPEKEIEEEILNAVTETQGLCAVETCDAFRNLQRVLTAALKRYWVPRYFIHLYQTVPKQVLSILLRDTPFDLGAVALERKMRCRIMFPRLYSSAPSSPGSPLTPVFVSNDTDKLPNSGVSNQSSETCTLTPDDEKIKDTTPDSEKIDPRELFALWSGQGFSRNKSGQEEKKQSTDYEEKENTDEYGLRELASWEKQQSLSPADSQDATYVIPLSVTSYISGRRRLGMGRFRTVSDRMLCAFASDALAGSPFKVFLKMCNLIQDVRLLEFWADVRHYLDTDDTYLDPYGVPMKRKLARVITDKYLIFNNDLEYEIFSENLKMSIFQSLSSKDDITLLSNAQNIISCALKESWKEYTRNERRHFRMKVISKTKFDRNVIEVPPGSASTRGVTDPLFYANSNTRCPTSTLQDHIDFRPRSTGSTTCSRPWSQLTTDMGGPINFTEEHSLKSLELVVLCAEYGRSGVFPQVQCKIEDLIDVLYSDYGSLHITREPSTRNEHLHKLLHKPKIDIENIKVSRKVIMDSPDIIIDRGMARSRMQRLVLRRRGILIERPHRPRNFTEVLQSSVHFEFFKRFMMVNKTLHPLLFWKYIEDLKEAQSARHRNHLIQVIYRKFFSKSAKQGYLLDCSDDIIRQIPTMERIPASVLICAQASVFRSMERKWFPKYLDTYPVDADYPPPERVESNMTPSPTFADLSEQLRLNKEAITYKKQIRRKRKTLHLWHGFVHLIMDFMDALKDENEFRLLELYLRSEQEKDTKHRIDKQLYTKANQPVADVTEKGIMTSSTVAAFQTRVVLRNRLVIVNKLVADLNFWHQVTKFKKHVDDLSDLENITRQDMDFLHLKAKAIIDCYLMSEVVPRVQINVPSDLATSIAVSLQQSGPTRGLFHDATILLFPVLYYFWKRFREEWLKGHDPKDFYIRLKEKMKVPWRATTPHKNCNGPDYLNVTESQCQMMSVNLHDDEPFRINFSLMGGVKYMFSAQRGTKPSNPLHGVVQEHHHGKRKSHRHHPKENLSPMQKVVDGSNHGEMKSKLDLKTKSKHQAEKEESVRTLDHGDAEPKTGSPYTKTNDSEESPSHRRKRQSIANTALQDKALRLSQLVEELNTDSGSGGRPIAQRLRTFHQVVRAALSTQTQSSIVSDTSNSITSLILS